MPSSFASANPSSYHLVPMSGSAEAPAAAIETALREFPRTPYVLQEFHKGRQYEVEYFDPHSGEIRSMAGRARLSPYYFVTGGRVELAGILATICPADKKVIHGMKDAVMVPCALV